MECLKCGKTTENEQAFCAKCLAAMDAYPVKPDVHVQLPIRRAAPTPKRASRKRRLLSAEERAAYLQGRVRRMARMIALLVILLCAAVAALVYIGVAQGWFALVIKALFG